MLGPILRLVLMSLPITSFNVIGTLRASIQSLPRGTDVRVSYSVQHETNLLKDTNLIASWLASTAKECEYPTHLLPSTSVSATKHQTAGGRL